MHDSAAMLERMIHDHGSGHSSMHYSIDVTKGSEE